MGIGFDQQVIAITGAAAGLGRSYALEFARRGGAVVVNDIGAAVDGTGEERSAAERVVDEIRALGGRAVAAYGSVSDEESAQAVVDVALAEFGRLDVLVNNAGILRDRALHNMTEREWTGVLDVHLRGAFLMTRASLRVMREQNYGRVVFATSNAGLFGNFGQANYASAKAALVGLSRVVSIEGKKYGIASNVVAPVAKTRMTETMGAEFERFDPEAVVPMVAFLASRECDRSGRVYSAAAWRYAEVFTGLAEGWLHPGASAEDIADHLPAIEDKDGYILPRTVFDELDQIRAALDAYDIRTTS
jgi:NAD(P)-dependent dehydrogenase (short-subunit alcohol dehydrogenase family)